MRDLFDPESVSPSTTDRILHFDLELLTALVDIVLALSRFRLERPVEHSRFLWDCSTALGKDNKLVLGDLELLHRFSNDFLVATAGIDVGSIPG